MTFTSSMAQLNVYNLHYKINIATTEYVVVYPSLRFFILCLGVCTIFYVSMYLLNIHACPLCSDLFCVFYLSIISFLGVRRIQLKCKYSCNITTVVIQIQLLYKYGFNTNTVVIQKYLLYKYSCNTNTIVMES